MIVVIKDSQILYSQVTPSKVESFDIAKTLFDILPKPVLEPQAVKINEVPYLVVASYLIPTLLHVREEFCGANILILDDFKHYGEKVKSYYASFSKEDLFKEVLKYRIQEVLDGNASTLV